MHILVAAPIPLLESIKFSMSTFKDLSTSGSCLRWTQLPYHSRLHVCLDALRVAIPKALQNASSRKKLMIAAEKSRHMKWHAKRVGVVSLWTLHLLNAGRPTTSWCIHCLWYSVSQVLLLSRVSLLRVAGPPSSPPRPTDRSTAGHREFNYRDRSCKGHCP